MGWKVTTTADPSLSAGAALLKLPFVGVQAPATSDYGAVNTLTALTFPSVGFYNSAKNNGGQYIAFPQSTFDYYANLGVRVIQWTMQLQDNSSGVDTSSDPNFSCQAIVNGNHDAWLTSMATGLAGLTYPGVTIELRVLHEFDGNWYPWGCLGGNNGNTPALIKAAWMHIWDLMKPICPDVKFVFCPDSYGTAPATIDAATPAAGYLDYIGVDCYNWGPSSLGPHGWRTPSQMFSSTKTWGDGIGKPFVICEVGCPFAPAGSFPNGTGDKNAWIASLATYLAGWGNLRGFYWEQNQNKGNCRINRIRTVEAHQFPNPNSYSADTAGTYVDHSAAAFAAAFGTWI